jgi:hypothetical protein
VHLDKTELRLSQAFAAEQTTGAIYGRLIHAFFQQVRWLEDFQVESEKLTEVARRTVEADLLQRVSIERAIDEFTAMLELNSVRQCLSRSRYKGRILAALPDRIEIENEYPISGLMNGELISGTIDRLVVLYRQGQPYTAEIFDFKTDAYDPKLNLLWVDERVQHHRPQLSTYANYMAHALHLDAAQVAAHLLLLSSDDCVRIEPLVPKPHYTPSESLPTR